MSTHLDGKDLIELLDLLEPVPVPVPISLWPQTPGWIVLGVVVLALLAVGVRHLRARHRADAYRRAALAELAQTGDDAALIAALLRRTALAGFPREQVAGLTGKNWMNFLDQSYGGKGFSGSEGKTLLAAPYRHNTHGPALSELARTWIATHKQVPS